MTEKNPQRRVFSLRYPAHLLEPEDLLGFIHSKQFDASWKRMGLTDEDLCKLQVCIIASPKGAHVIEATDGLRKLRFSPDDSDQGKSGSHRACYVYFEEHAIVFLATAYPKGKKASLRPA